MTIKLLHFIRLIGADVIQIVSRIFPIDNRIFLFYAHKRKGLCCNPKYIMMEIAKQRKGKYKLYWITEYPETIEKSDDYKIIKRRSVKYYYLCSRAKVLITNDILDETLIKRRNQIYINTWHGGGAFKKAGFDIVKTWEEEKLLHTWYDKMDYMIASSQYLAEQFQQAFHLNENQILRIGMPRSDVFFFPDRMDKHIRGKYKIGAEVKIVLYAPTYSLSEYKLLSEKEMLKVLEALQWKFGGKWTFLVKTHYFDQNEHYTYIPGKIMSCNDYYDTQELLCGIDLLITDYSSLLWDISVLNKPCISYACEPEKYSNEERDFYIPYEKWPYAKCRNVQQLIDVITNYNYEHNIEKEREFVESLGSYEHGDSSRRFVEILESKLVKI